MTVKVFQH